MCADYGFRSGAGRLYQEGYGEVPKNVWQLVCVGEWMGSGMRRLETSLDSVWFYSNSCDGKGAVRVGQVGMSRIHSGQS